MKRMIFTLLCLGVLGTITGCYYDPALYGPPSVEVGIGATTVEQPYYVAPYSYRVYERDDRQYRRWKRVQWRGHHRHHHDDD
jgi:hypothetical protein